MAVALMLLQLTVTVIVGLYFYRQLRGQERSEPGPVSYTHLDVYKRQFEHEDQHEHDQEHNQRRAHASSSFAFSISFASSMASSASDMFSRNRSRTSSGEARPRNSRASLYISMSM